MSSEDSERDLTPERSSHGLTTSKRKNNYVDPEIYYNEYPLFEEFDKEETIIYSRFHGRKRYCICCCNVTFQVSFIFIIELCLNIAMFTYQTVSLSVYLDDPIPPINTHERDIFDQRVILFSLIVITEAYGFIFSIVLAIGIFRRKIPLVVAWILSAPVHIVVEMILLITNWPNERPWHEIIYVILKAYWIYVMYHYYDILKFDQALRDHHLQKKRLIAKKVLNRARDFVMNHKVKALKNLKDQRFKMQKELIKQAKADGSKVEVIPISEEEHHLEKRLLEMGKHNSPFSFMACCRKLKNNPSKIAPAASDHLQAQQVHLVNLKRRKSRIAKEDRNKKIKHVYEIPFELLLTEHRERSPQRISEYFKRNEQDDIDLTAKWVQESNPGPPTPRSSL